MKKVTLVVILFTLSLSPLITTNGKAQEGQLQNICDGPVGWSVFVQGLFIRPGENPDVSFRDCQGLPKTVVAKGRDVTQYFQVKWDIPRGGMGKAEQAPTPYTPWEEATHLVSREQYMAETGGGDFSIEAVATVFHGKPLTIGGGIVVPIPWVYFYFPNETRVKQAVLTATFPFSPSEIEFSGAPAVYYTLDDEGNVDRLIVKMKVAAAPDYEE